MRRPRAISWNCAAHGKSVFVKFQAPNDEACKRMKPDWDKLMLEFKGDKNRLVADVECTAGGKDLCSDKGVRGYPTIKYGDPNNLEDYKGGRDLASMKAFALESLGHSCGPTNLDLCDDANKKQIESFLAMPLADLKKAIADKDAEMAKAESDMKTLTASLQKQYEEGTKAKDETQKAINESGLGLMKSVQAHQKTSKSEL